jgi:hypothetical protein
MIKKLVVAISLLIFPILAMAEGAGQTVEQIYYCGDDFAMRMSGGDWYLVQKSEVGEKKQDHFLSMAMFMMASGKKTANVFPGEPVSNWCGNAGFRPINKFSIQN